jgi:predicted PurR-regulated permease PerM
MSAPAHNHTVAMALVATVATLWLLHWLQDIITPLVVAAVLVVLVQALIRTIDNRWRWMPTWLVVTAAAVVIIVALGTALTVLVQGVSQLVSQAPPLYARIGAILLDLSAALRLDQPLRLATLLGNVSLPQLARQLLGAVQGLFSSLLLVILYFVFLLAERRKVARKVRNITNSSARSSVVMLGIDQVSQDIETYVWVQTVTGLMLAAGSGLVMVAVGLENALFWTFVLFLLSFIPILGVTVGSIAPAAFALLQFPTLWQALSIFGGIQLVAFVIGNLVYPRMQAKTQNISPIATLLSLAFWSFLWGMPGAFLSVPLTLLLMLVCAKFDSARWVAVLLSNDGTPSATKKSRESSTEVFD